MGALKAPPLLLGSTILLWGWQQNLWVFALPLALLLEAASLPKWRWRLADREINRIVDSCSLVLVLLVLYAVIAKPVASAVFTVITWLPVILFPLIFIQRYSNREALPLTALSLQKRRQKKVKRKLDVSYPYFMVCLLSAASGRDEPMLFYPAVVILAAWALWRQRSERFSFGFWLGLVVLAGAGGYLTHLGYMQLQGYLENQIPVWLLEKLEREHDPYRRSTALGHIGRLKLSNRIVLRVVPVGGHKVPELLRVASYNVLIGDTWLARAGSFQPLARRAGMNWRIYKRRGQAERIRIFQNLKKGRGMLPLPLGTSEVANIPAEQVERNPLGAVKVLGGPDFINYEVSYHPQDARSLPMDEDIQIPKLYREELADIAMALGLSRQPRHQVPTVLERFFNEHFAYSLDLDAIDNALPPLVDFLRNTRSGHCEYFAAATVLLLRQAGIPARYASGYSVQEYSNLAEQFIVRRRHAHAWAIAYIDGHWQSVDTTPAVWVTAEADQASSFLTGFYDVVSWLWWQLAKWKMLEVEAEFRAELSWLLPPLILLLILRLRRRKRVYRQQRDPIEAHHMSKNGADSELYHILDWYASRGRKRTSGETLTGWSKRIIRDKDADHDELLKEILQLHYRYRFDPAGLSEIERVRLRQRVQAWFKNVGK